MCYGVIEIHFDYCASLSDILLLHCARQSNKAVLQRLEILVMRMPGGRHVVLSHCMSLHVVSMDSSAVCWPELGRLRGAEQ